MLQEFLPHTIYELKKTMTILKRNSFHRIVVVVKIVVQPPQVLEQHQDGILTTLFVTVVINNEIKVYHVHFVEKRTDISQIYQWFNVNSVRSLFTESVTRLIQIWYHINVQTVECVR